MGNSLRFDPEKYIEQTVKITNRSGEHEVVVHSWRNVVYVSRPVDPLYQSMNVDVPVSIDGKAVDTANAPILFALRVGGYAKTPCGKTVPPSMETPEQREARLNPARHLGGMTGRLGNGAGGPGGPGGPGAQGKKRLAPPPFNRSDDVLDYALAAGHVLITPGNRGNGCDREDGTHFGKAPATIVDLKAAIRYMRANGDAFPGNKDHIVTNGRSAGGAMSSLLGTSGDSALYNKYFEAIGAADADDHVFACGVFCPMCDLENADIAQEWAFGKYPNMAGELVNQELSAKLAAQFPEYQKSLHLTMHDGKPLTAEAYPEYLAKEYLIPSANRFLLAMDEKERAEYLQNNQWIGWNGQSADFTLEDLRNETGRLKDVPAFDDLAGEKETRIFGREDEDYAHFTDFAANLCGQSVSDHVKEQVKLVNPMRFLRDLEGQCADNWWIRLGTRDHGMSFIVAANLSTTLENQGKNVDLKFYWDAGHYTDLDPEDFIEWVNNLTGWKL